MQRDSGTNFISMRPVATCKLEDTDETKGMALSPKFLPYLYDGGGNQRRSSIRGQPVGCLSLLDAVEQVERPRAIPSPGLEGKETPPTNVKIVALPTIHVHRPRAVLSSPENDDLISELQVQQGEQLTIRSNASKALSTVVEEDLSIASISPSKEAPKAFLSPPDDFFGAMVGDGQTSTSEEGPSCSSSSNGELADGLSPSVETSSQRVVENYKQSKIISSTATKEKCLVHSVALGEKCLRIGNQENVSGTNAINRVVKKHGSLLLGTSHGPGKQQVSKPVSKGDSTRVLRPWY